ncbi:MAG: hypothetical protein ABF820_12400, partial [Sporolactobacillus sp.]
ITHYTKNYCIISKLTERSAYALDQRQIEFLSDAPKQWKSVSNAWPRTNSQIVAPNLNSCLYKKPEIG